MNQQIQKGDKVIRTFAWKETENPSDKNFHIGEVLEVFQRGQFTYYDIDGLDNFAPADRVKLVRSI